MEANIAALEASNVIMKSEMERLIENKNFCDRHPPEGNEDEQRGNRDETIKVLLEIL